MLCGLGVRRGARGVCCILGKMRSAEREPKQGGERSSRRLFLVILGILVALLVMFLLLRPRGSDAGPPQQTTQHQ